MKDYLLNTIAADKWSRITTRKRSGVVIPLFFVYSKDSQGIGDYVDLKLAIDWCVKSGNSILQLLPLNEMGPFFCPYDAISSCALETAHIRIKPLKEKLSLKKPFIDYGIKEKKKQLLSEIFKTEDVTKDKELGRFVERNSYWIYDYAVFKVLKDYQQGRPWYEWDDKYRSAKDAAVGAFQQEHKKEVAFYIWAQYLAFRQLKEAREYARENKVLLKGDLPILISRDSVDVWAHPEFFKLDFSAGAPPDMYCAKGQRWGMPTYNWQNIASDNYRYLKEKIRYAENFYDILRVDHVVGLFRIWGIPYNEPLENQGLNGVFDPEDEKLWGGHGKSILSVMLKNSSMLLCAEDLGTIPKICPKTLKELGVPGNDVQRWVKDWKARHDFLLPSEYRRVSVAMLSTHDTTNWPAWWENEAGTIDEALFIRKCQGRVDYNKVMPKLFDSKRSRHGRLRWQESVESVDTLVNTLGKKKEELLDFVEMYENSYKEKEKLWRYLLLKGKMREACDREIMRHVLRAVLESEAIFCINTIIDILYLSDIFKGDPYAYRINTPGTSSAKNWSLTLPIPLEELLKHKVNKDIYAMNKASGRI
ncbi:MAG: 4-alpha-glucanotransferase [Candidatus Omnitrophica bacterium]|nr:4-alpha-glucanotransferase [Candidatus Omnitrophota bacterium]